MASDRYLSVAAEWDGDRVTYVRVNGQVFTPAEAVAARVGRTPAAQPGEVVLPASVVADVRGGLGSLLYVANNMHLYGTAMFRGYLEAAIEDARRGYAALPAPEPTDAEGGVT